MKKDKFSLFSTDEERKKMNLSPLAKPEDKYSILDDKSRQGMGMAPRAKPEDNFSLTPDKKPSKMQSLLDMLSAQGKKSAQGLGKAVDVQAPSKSQMPEQDEFKPGDIKSAEFGNVNTIKPQEFDFQSKMEILKKLMGMQ